jgi:hypothetical protein
MKKKTVVIIVIGGLVLLAALWGASRHFGWFEEEVSIEEPIVEPIEEPIDTFVYDESVPIDLENKTKVFDLVILDMSGSMDTIRQSVVDGFNKLVDGLRMANNRFSGTQEHYLTLCLFNMFGMEYVYYNTPIDSVSTLTLDSYQPNGSTPLYDAMGVSISIILEDVDTLSEYSVMVTIISDGLENASRFYSKALISWVVNELSEKGWSFSYMGTDEEVLEQAMKLNIDSVYYFQQTDFGFMEVMRMDERSRMSKYRAIDSLRRRTL